MNHADTESSPSMVLVTGANSLLGTHIIKRLLSEGYQVNGLLREKNRFHLPQHPNLALTEGDFTDPKVIMQALQGCAYVIHVAACTDQGITSYDHYYSINVAATQQLAQLAITCSIKRFVYVSTANCFGFGSKEKPGNEMQPPQYPFTHSNYANSKLEAQHQLLGMESDMEIVIVNPTFMLGAYDTKPGSGRIILMAHGRRIVMCPPGGKNFVNAWDVAGGVVNALQKGECGEAYLLSGENLSYKEFYWKMSEATGQKQAYLVLPKAVLTGVGLLGNLLKGFGIQNQFTLTNMKMLCINNYYTNRKAIEALGFETNSVSQGIIEAVEWFNTHGMIKK